MKKNSVAVWEEKSYCHFRFCLPHPKTTTCHHQPSAMTHTFAWHLQHKTSIQCISTIYLLGYLGVMVEFGRTFFFPSLQKVCQNYISTPGLPSRYVVLMCCMLVLCSKCQAKAWVVAELMVAGCCIWAVANKFWNSNKQEAEANHQFMSPVTIFH